MAAKDDTGAGGEQPAPSQPAAGQSGAAQEGRQEVRLRIDERNLDTTYANMFRTDATADEIMLYFGLNVVNPAATQQGRPEFIFQVNDRIVMGYGTAKRLAMAMSQLIRRHEEQFGEIELDLNKRRKGGK